MWELIRTNGLDNVILQLLYICYTLVLALLVLYYLITFTLPLHCLFYIFVKLLVLYLFIITRSTFILHLFYYRLG